MIILFTALLGLAYPLAITGIAGVILPAEAHGSLVMLEGRAVGSSLIGQSFISDRYFRGRPSATGDAAYNATASGGTNLGPTSARLKDMVAAEISKFRAEGVPGLLPADSVTSSGSGLDPDISPAFAKLQINRVAKARNAPQDQVASLVEANTEKPALGFIGEPRVNVLKLNMALDIAWPQE